MNYINYIKHSLYTPDTYHRRYDVDLSGKPAVADSPMDIARRVGLTILPFLALYRPAGVVMSVGMGSCRLISNLASAISMQQEQDWAGVGSALALSACSVASLAGTVFSSTVGLFISTISDIGVGCSQVIQLGWNGQYAKGIEEGAQTLASALYLGFMVTGTLEVILFSVLVQAALSLYQAKGEIEQGHYIEALGKGALACVKGYQVQEYRKLIQRRDQLFAIKKYQELVARAIRAKTASSLANHPLSDLQALIAERAVVLSSHDQEYDCGSHVHGYGQGIVKGDNLQWRRVNVDGKAVLELQFQLNHPFRDQLQTTLKDLSRLGVQEMQEILHLTGGVATGLSVEKRGALSALEDFLGSDGLSPPQYYLQMPGLGSVSVGALTNVSHFGDVKLLNRYDRVTVRVEEGKTLYDMRDLLTFLDLDKALSPSMPDDIERLKLGHLFHTFFPREALTIEREKNFYEMKPEDLKALMIAKVPDMQQVYDTYFDRMKPSEIVPGQIRYRIDGLAEEVSKRGISYLMSAVTGGQEDATLFPRVAAILSIGMCSTDFRDQNRIGQVGLSRFNDYLSGGADSVFTQLLPTSIDQNLEKVEGFSWYGSRVRMLFSLQALELGTYQYLHCGAGHRDIERDWWQRRGANYANRLNILDFSDELVAAQARGESYKGHEVMLKSRLDPSYVTGMIVDDESTKLGLIKYLTNLGLVSSNAEGQQTILGRLVDQFIRVTPASQVRMIES